MNWIKAHSFTKLDKTSAAGGKGAFLNKVTLKLPYDSIVKSSHQFHFDIKKQKLYDSYKNCDVKDGQALRARKEKTIGFNGLVYSEPFQ